MANPALSNALQMPDPLAPKPPAQKQTLADAERRLTEVQGQLGNATGEYAEFEGLKERQKATDVAGMAAGELDLKKRMQEQVAAPELRAERQEAVEQISRPFVPTRENVADMAGLFSLISVIGFAIGLGGKNHAMAAMSAMNGMMEGHRQGREDLYKKEKDLFESNVKSLKTRIDTINAEIADVEKLAAIDYDKGMSAFKYIAAKNDADFLSKYVDKVGLPKTIELLKTLEKQAQTTVDKMRQEETRAHEKEIDRKNRLQPSYTFVEKEGKVYAINTKNPADIREVSGDLAGGVKAFSPAGKGGGVQATSERVMQQDIGNAVFNLKDLAALGKSEGKIPGGSAAFANSFKGDLTADIRRYIETQVIDANPQTIDALMTNLAFDIASAQTGGRGQLSDTKVKAVVSQMPLESQPESTKKARWRAVLVRVEEANKTLPESKQIEIPKAVKDYFGGGESSGGGAPKEGDTGTSNSGRPIVYRNGKWEYQ